MAEGGCFRAIRAAPQISRRSNVVWSQKAGGIDCGVASVTTQIGAYWSILTRRLLERAAIRPGRRRRSESCTPTRSAGPRGRRAAEVLDCDPLDVLGRNVAARVGAGPRYPDLASARGPTVGPTRSTAPRRSSAVRSA